MTEFKEVPASKKSISNRRKVFGLGINDASYITGRTVNGIIIACPIYSRWRDMMCRCYSVKFHDKNPSYKNTSVCDEWLTFSNFYTWFKSNSICNYQLDKDIKIKGNRVYSPDSCLFVSRAVNNLMNSRPAKRGPYPLGVTFNRNRGTYVARVSTDKGREHVGSFKSPSDAHRAYKLAKNKQIKISMIKNPEIAKYLELHLYKI